MIAPKITIPCRQRWSCRHGQIATPPPRPSRACSPAQPLGLGLPKATILNSLTLVTAKQLLRLAYPPQPLARRQPCKIGTESRCRRRRPSPLTALPTQERKLFSPSPTKTRL